MTNVSTPEKVALRKSLFAFGVQALEQQGWRVARVARAGKASLRMISKGSQSHQVAIRTSQDTCIAFPRRSDDKGWVTLDDVDYIIAVSVDDRHTPKKARVHMIPGSEARARFDRAYAAKKKADYSVPLGRGIWLSLYDREKEEPVTLVGAGMGLDYKAIATFDLTKIPRPSGDEPDEDLDDEANEDGGRPRTSEPTLTIPEAKRLLALSLGVPESAIKISIEH